MSKCASEDMHSWQFMYTLGGTKTLPVAVFGCPCGMAKKVNMRWEFSRVHPDERVKHWKARAESAEQQGEDDEHS